MSREHYYVGKVLGLSLAQPLSLKQFSMLTQMAVTDSIEVWCLTDQIMFVSTNSPGVHLKPSSHTTQFLVKAVGGDTFFTARYSYSPAENNRCLNQIVSDSGDILATLATLAPFTDFLAFRKEVFRIEAELERANKEADQAARMRDLAHRKKYIDDVREQFMDGKMISAHDFALLLAEYRIWGSLSESMMAFVLNTLFRVNWQGTHEIADETNSDSPSRDILSHVASLLTQQIRDFPQPGSRPDNKAQERS